MLPIIMNKFIKRNIKKRFKHLENVVDVIKGDKDVLDAFNDGIDIEGEYINNEIEIGTNIAVNSVNKVASTLKVESDEKLLEGDILGVGRPFPKLIHHFGIYVGNGQVVHYTDSNYSKTNADIHKTSLKSFLTYKKDGTKIVQKKFYKINIESFAYDKDLEELSPDETVRNAESMINKKRGEYNLLFNNCETFANWCKFKKKMMFQGLNFAQRFYLNFDEL